MERKIKYNEARILCNELCTTPADSGENPRKR